MMSFGKAPATVASATKAGDDLSAAMDRLYLLVFSHSLPGVNEKVKSNFKTPFQMLHYLQSLVSVVLDSEKPTDATAHFWKHLHRCPAPPPHAPSAPPAKREAHSCCVQPRRPFPLSVLYCLCIDMSVTCPTRRILPFAPVSSAARAQHALGK